MTGKTILKAVHLDPVNFPEVSNIDVYLYDIKNRIDDRNGAVFARHWFEANPEEGRRFIALLNTLEKNPVPSLNLQVSETHIIAFYKSPCEKFFSRIPIQYMDPMDYMD